MNIGSVAENFLLWAGWARLEQDSDLQTYQNSLQRIK